MDLLWIEDPTRRPGSLEGGATSGDLLSEAATAPSPNPSVRTYRPAIAGLIRSAPESIRTSDLRLGRASLAICRDFSFVSVPEGLQICSVGTRLGTHSVHTSPATLPAP